MDKWDKKETNFDELIPVIKAWIESQKAKDEKDPLQHLSLTLTKKELKKVSDALNG